MDIRCSFFKAGILTARTINHIFSGPQLVAKTTKKQVGFTRDCFLLSLYRTSLFKTTNFYLVLRSAELHSSKEFMQKGKSWGQGVKLRLPTCGVGK